MNNEQPPEFVWFVKEEMKEGEDCWFGPYVHRSIAETRRNKLERSIIASRRSFFTYSIHKFQLVEEE